jgi:hypothetical protein
MGKVLFNQLILDDALLPSSTEVITDFRDLLPEYDTSSELAFIEGDFSTARYFLNEDDDCAGTSLDIAEFSDEHLIYISLDDLVNYPVFCIEAESSDIAIRRSEYSLNLGLGGETKLIGEVLYDAATIDLPYITDFSEYRQRIIFVNHAGYDVSYFTEFSVEESVSGHYSSGELASGVIPAGTTLIIKSNEFVNIESGVNTRVSARVLVDARPSDISAAIQILSIGNNWPPQTNVLQVFEY